MARGGGATPERTHPGRLWRAFWAAVVARHPGPGNTRHDQIGPRADRYRLGDRPHCRSRGSHRSGRATRRLRLEADRRPRCRYRPPGRWTCHRMARRRGSTQTSWTAARAVAVSPWFRPDGSPKWRCGRRRATPAGRLGRRTCLPRRSRCLLRALVVNGAESPRAEAGASFPAATKRPG
jgi:hypothetical protein